MPKEILPLSMRMDRIWVNSDTYSNVALRQYALADILHVSGMDVSIHNLEWLEKTKAAPYETDWR